jgi:PP-loop superfamily ATP-utilizing enzyme
VNNAPSPKSRSYRAHAETVRDAVLPIRLTAGEKAEIKALADRRGVSMARLMKEATLSESYDRRERLAVIAALDSANRLLANIAGNINQLAYHANIAQQLVARVELEHALGQVRELRDELGEVLRQVR